MLRSYERFFTFIRIILDAVMLASGLLLLCVTGMRPPEGSCASHLPLLVAVILVTVGVTYLADGYTPMRGTPFRKEVLGILKVYLTAAMLIIGMTLLLLADFHFVYAWAYGGTLVLFSRACLRMLLYRMREKGYNQKHILIVGAGPLGRRFLRSIRRHPEFGYQVVGFLDNDPRRTKISSRLAPVLGQISLLPERLARHDVDEVFIALPLSAYQQYRFVINSCELEGVRARIVFPQFRFLPGYPKIESFDGVPLVSVRHVALDDPLNRLLKRLLDIAVALTALILTAPLLLGIALLIKLTSPGPVFFRQERIGLNNKPFNMLKFRSMRVEERAVSETRWTTNDDPRKTWLGNFIRRTSLDELPQFINVLRGEMSVVGPRPERPFFVEQFKRSVPRYMVKHQVKPGITGWAQVNGWRGDTSIKHRIECDVYYIENWDILFDIKIMFLTVFKGFVNKHAY